VRDDVGRQGGERDVVHLLLVEQNPFLVVGDDPPDFELAVVFAVQADVVGADLDGAQVVGRIGRGLLALAGMVAGLADRVVLDRVGRQLARLVLVDAAGDQVLHARAIPHGAVGRITQGHGVGGAGEVLRGEGADLDLAVERAGLQADLPVVLLLRLQVHALIAR
jgi:hypothetical protein